MFVVHFTSLNRAELKNLLKEKFKHIKIIDVRSPQEYAEQHIPEPENIPSDELFQKEMKTDEQEIIVMACTYGGQRSQKAAEGKRDLKMFIILKAVLRAGLRIIMTYR